jgi:gliding motility-associated-like protein
VLLCCVLLFVSTFLLGQNLVPNPSFESYNSLPNYRGQLWRLNDWYNPTSDTPDFFHENATDNSASVPQNWLGTQSPRTGKAYIGIHTWLGQQSDEREFASIELLDSLEIGQEYRLIFYTSLEDRRECATNGMGFYFTRGRPRDLQYDYYDEEIHYYEPNIIYNSNDWIKVEGYFVANENYNTVTLGNFLEDDDPRLKVEILDNTIFYKSCSYYIDDVSIEATNKKLSIDWEQTNECFPIEITASVEMLPDASDWRWFLDDNPVDSSGNTTLLSFDENGTHILHTEIIHNGILYEVKDTIEVNGIEPPIAQFELIDEPVFDESIQFNNLSELATSYDWDFGDGSTSQEINPYHTYGFPKEYLVTLIATNDVGCQDIVQKTFYTRCKGRIIHNVFTPNGDGRNDQFYFDSLAICGEMITIQVFNRWGKVIFQTNDPYLPWDGGDFPSGTYYYVAKYRDGEEGGFITLIRE